VYLHPLADLLQVKNTSDIVLLAKNRAQDLGEEKEIDVDRALQSFYGQAALWMHFLQDAQGGRWRDPFLKFFQTSMNGLGGLDSFFVAFRGTDLSTLDREFWMWAFAEHERALPKVHLDRAFLETLFSDRGARPKAAVS